MAHLDDLIDQVQNAELRLEMQRALAALKRKQKFGLVYEEHIPETTALQGLPIRPGALVQRRDDPTGERTFLVVEVDATEATATVVPVGGEEQEEVPARDLLVVKRFGDPIYPTLTPLGEVRRGEDDRPFHAVINGENYHALQLLLYLYEGQVDCIYIDPPYNTGARDWKYNNRFVDSNDAWRHSKWLSMMEKRLRLAGRLLNEDGVLIVTIDEHELNHLGVLLSQLFTEAFIQLVTIVINPSGVTGTRGLSRVEEYAYFCFFGESREVMTLDDMYGDETRDLSKRNKSGIRWEWLLRGGNKWYRDSRPNLCYPVLVNDSRTHIVGVGEPYSGPDNSRPSKIDGHVAAWPLRKDGKLGIWRVEASTLAKLAEKGYAHISSREGKENPTLRYLLSGTIRAIECGDIKVVGRGERGEVLVEPVGPHQKRAKTVWSRGRHIAGGSGGTQLLNVLLGERNVFPFPKSIYAVQDSLDVAVGDRDDAIIVDFFAGSGTTLHATLMLNAADGGRRRCVLVTNNEVGEEDERGLRERGVSRGNAKYEAHGIFHRATRPRVEAAITGMRPDGRPIEGAYLNGDKLADGFEENAAFFGLDYLDPDEIDLGRQYAAIAPLLWLTAGGVGQAEVEVGDSDFSISDDSTYAVLFRESRFREFREALEARPDVTHIWLVTDSENAFAEMRSILPSTLKVGMLYRDYLRNFRINTARPQ